jgi:hypothetical protein
MKGYKEDTCRNFVTLFFFSLLLLFLFSAADRPGNSPSSSLKTDSQKVLSCGNISDQFPVAAIAHSTKIPDLQKYAGFDLIGSRHNPSSITDRHRGYNQSINIHLTLAQRERLTFVNVCLIHSYINTVQAGDDDAPVLS